MSFFDLFRRRSSMDRLRDELLSEVKKSFTLKNPTPLQIFAADLLGITETSVTKPYAQSIWAYRCVNIWKQIAQVPMILQDAKKNLIDTGPEKYLLDHPNSKMDTVTFAEYLIMSMGCYGEFFVLREDGSNDNTKRLPQYLTVVSPGSMKLTETDFDRNGNIVSWTINVRNGEQRKIKAGAVIRCMLPNPYSNNKALSPMEVLKLTLSSDNSARLHNKWLTERHGQITGLLSLKDTVGSEQLKLLADLWREKYEGAENAGKTAILDGGAEYQQLSMNNKDMDWESGQKMNREEICAAFGVPPNNAGILDKATYSNYEQSTKSLWTDTLIPLGNKIAATLNMQLFLPASGNKVYCSFDFDNNVKIIQDDLNTQIDRYTKLVNAFVSPERAAELTGIKLGTITPAQKEIWVSPMLIPASDVLSNAPDSVPPPGTADDSTQPKTLRSAVLPLLRELEEKKRKEKTDQDNNDVLPPTQDSSTVSADNTKESVRYKLRQARGRSIVRQAAGYERQLRSTLKRYFQTQHQQVLDNFNKIAAHLKAQKQDGVVLKVRQTPSDMADLLLKGKDWNKELIKRCAPILKAAGILSAKNMLVELGKNKTDFREDSLRAFWNSQESLIKHVNDTTAKALVDAGQTLIDTLSSGASPEDAAAAMKGKIDTAFGIANESRRIMIARTETLRAVNGARFEEMKDAQVERHQWLAVMDSETRESHASIDNEVVTVGSKFSNGLEYPLDPLAPADETINCRCTTVAYFGD